MNVTVTSFVVLLGLSATALSVGQLREDEDALRSSMSTLYPIL